MKKWKRLCRRWRRLYRKREDKRWKKLYRSNCQGWIVYHVWDGASTKAIGLYRKYGHENTVRVYVLVDELPRKPDYLYKSLRGGKIKDFSISFRATDVKSYKQLLDALIEQKQEIEYSRYDSFDGRVTISVKSGATWEEFVEWYNEFEPNLLFLVWR